MTITTVKYKAKIETPTVYTGYLINNQIVTSNPSSRNYREAEAWIAQQGNTPEPAYTQQEINDNTTNTNYSDMEKAVDGIKVIYKGHTYSGSRDAQNGMNTAMLKLVGKGDNKTQNWYTVDKVKQKLNRDDFDNLLDMIEPLMEDITDD